MSTTEGIRSNFSAVRSDKVHRKCVQVKRHLFPASFLQTFPATSAGMERAITWIRRRTGGERVFAAVEATSSYGARLTQVLLAPGIDVGEVWPPSRSSRALTGKSDPIDAEAAARSVLGRLATR